MRDTYGIILRASRRCARQMRVALIAGSLLMAGADASSTVSPAMSAQLRARPDAAAETVVTAKRPSLPRRTPVMFALPSVPRPTQSLTVDARPERPMTTLEYAATLRSPLGQLSISSPYGARLHPVKKQQGFHYGVDYVAASGTPIRAAQDGVILSLGKRAFYGNYLRIDHGHGVETVYGHLLKFMPGLKNGSVIRRGDIVGFVGSTGRATGAHLHFEVLADGKQVDPLRLTMAFAPDRLLSMK